jgi:isopropanol dehydrogenase (NADP+)
MKAFVFEAENTMVWKDVPIPQIQEPYGALLRPIALSPCSSDVHTVYEGGKPKQTNHILGHECIARIEKIGSLVCDFKVGDIVAVPAITPNWRAVSIQEGNYRHAEDHFAGHRLGRTWPGTFSEFFAIPDADTNLAHIPDGVTVEQALMCVDVMTTGFTGAEAADIKTGDTVCVIGIGPIGLMAVAAAAHLGASKIIAIGTRPICVDLAKKYGANEVISYKEEDIVKRVLSETNNIGPDSVIIAGGGDQVFTQAIDMVRYGIGTVSNINYFAGSEDLVFPKFSSGRGMAGKTIRTELAKGGRARIERMLNMVRYGRVDPSMLITHRFSGLESIEQALLLMRDKPTDLIKIIVKVE